MRTDALKFKTIAVATDLSEAGNSVLRYAQAIARWHKSALLIVHVIDPVSYAFPNGPPDALAADEAARDELNRIEEDTRRQGIPVHSVIESGIICERILQALADQRADLLVLGTRAKTEAGRVALGTVARQLLARSPCPILTVSPDPHLRLTGEWRHVLAATDFSAASVSALRYAHRIAYHQLLALHVQGCSNERERPRCLERLRFLAPLNESHTVPVEHIVVPGDAPGLIAEYAQRFHADLVVLGAPANELTAEDFHTSTVLQVISRVSCPVLCVPSGKDSSPVEIIEEVSHTC